MEICKTPAAISFSPLYYYAMQQFEEDMKQEHTSFVLTHLPNVDAGLRGGFTSGVHLLFCIHQRCVSDFTQQLVEAFAQQKYATVYLTNYVSSFDVYYSLLSRMLYKRHPHIADSRSLHRVIQENPEVYADIQKYVEPLAKYISVVQMASLDTSALREALVRQRKKYNKLVVVFNHSDFSSVHLQDEDMLKKYFEMTVIANDLDLPIIIAFLLTVSDCQRLISGQSDIMELILRAKNSMLLQPHEGYKEMNSKPYFPILLDSPYSTSSSFLMDVWFRPFGELNFTHKTHLLYYPHYTYFQEA
jgi:hypothetical protein